MCVRARVRVRVRACASVRDRERGGYFLDPLYRMRLGMRV